MIRTEDSDRAFGIEYHADCGTLGLNDGSVVSGQIITVGSKYDDSNGIGCIDVLTNEDENSGTSVYANQLAWTELDESDVRELPEHLHDGE